MRLHRITSNFTDGQLAETSRTLRLLLIDKLSDFENFDPMFNAAFVDEWLAAIRDFEGHQNDENTLDLLQQYTLDLEDAAKKAWLHIQGLEYYLQLAYPGQSYKRAEFGLDALTRLRQTNFAQMIRSFQDTYYFMMQDLPDFLAAGMPAGFPAQFQAAIQAMDDADTAQSRYKITRLRLTRQRIKKFNHLYGIHKQIAKAARVIYHNDPIMIDLYTMI